MGKTLLAQHIYNDSKMTDEFDVKTWVCISDEFDVFKITRAILEGINGSIDDSRDLNMVQERLKEKLTGKRFLLVLDDIWNEKRDQWEALQTPFNYGARGSKIIVTTRNLKVALTTRSTRIHHLEELQEEHCLQLFSRHAFQDENPQSNPELMEIGKKIIGKCKGLPLSLKTIGSLLYTKSSLVEWKIILSSEIWDLPEEVSNIVPALRLSYDHLPSHLKRCFASCSLFPKDYVFEKEQLILIWMAENFLQCPQPQQSKSMLEVGEQYFDDLLSRLEVDEAQNVSKVTRHFSFLRY
ncbi:disease resistance protein, partial [Trifolium medium]|nr:disease resistance protein [Trifolium medium]